MEKVWINEGKPKKVIEKDDVHYFYFPVELGMGSIRIFGIELPLPLPIKVPDYEPVKIVRFKGRTQVISRFHYEILTYFNNPKLLQKRAVVDFSLGSHSPYVHTKDGSRLGTKIALGRLGAIEVRWVRLLISIYLEIVTGRMRIGLHELDDYDVKKGEVPEEVVFEPQKCHSVIWVGEFPEKKGTPLEVWNVLED